MCNLSLLNQGPFYTFILVVQIIFYLMAIIGLVCYILKKRIPVVCSVCTFCVANIGIGVGVVKGIIGKSPATYSGLNKYERD